VNLRLDPETTFSEYFGVHPKILATKGVFDPLLGLDTPLAIDPKLLDTAPEPEMQGSHDEVLARFGDVFKLLALSEKEGDKAWRSARERLKFPEFKGVSLGTSQSRGNGSGWGPEITEQVLLSSSEIVNAGLTDPAFFELLALFERRIGADRIGDMLGTILTPRLIAYTQRICSEIGVPTQDIPVQGRPTQLPTWIDEKNKRRYVILVPQSILSDLPVGQDRSEIEYVASRNSEARDFLNRAIGADWRTRVASSTAPQTKAATRAAFFSNIPYFKQFIEHYKKRQPSVYDFENDPKALRLIHDVLAWAQENLVTISPPATRSAQDVYEVVREIVLHFKLQAEQNRLAKAFFVDARPRREAIVQGVFQAVADAHCKYNNLDLSPEVNSGRGPVDFKFSDGQRARVLVELKLSNSTQLIHGFEMQLQAYEAAENTDLSIYLVIDTGYGSSDSALDRLSELVDEAKKKNIRMPEVIVVDVTPKPSGSKA
jgi:hypothetical protein